MLNDVFEAAVDAVISGDAEELRRLLNEHPELAKQRSTREHRGTLLHYLVANGVEDERQRIAENALEIAKILIHHGADLNTTFLDGKSGTTPLVSLVTSVHPHTAGVATDLVELFVRRGARVNGLHDDGEPLGLALRFGYPESAEALIAAGASVEAVRPFPTGNERVDSFLRDHGRVT